MCTEGIESAPRRALSAVLALQREDPLVARAQRRSGRSCPARRRARRARTRAALDASLPVRSRRSTPAWAARARDGRRRARPRVAAAPSSASVIVTPSEAESCPQQRLDPRRPRRRLGVEGRVRRIRDHHDRHSGRDRRPKRKQSDAVELGGVAAISTAERSVLRVARPIPGKCFTAAATRAPASPLRERAVAPRDAAGLAANVRSLERHERPRTGTRRRRERGRR